MAALSPEKFKIIGYKEEEANRIDRPTISYWQDAWRRLRKNPVAVASMIALVLLIIMVIAGPLIRGYDYTSMNVAEKNIGPCAQYWFGTDNLGRDIFSRMLHGARVSLTVGFLATICSGIVGTILGLISGYFGGIVDHVIMRIADAFYAIPGILLALVTLMVVQSSGIGTLVIVIAAISWVQYARLIRAEVLRLKGKEFVRASRTIGASPWFIISHHIVPNVWPTFIVVSTMSVASSILTEASLSFLGVGIQSPLISWGGMLSDGRALLATHWWVATFPGIMITIAILGITFMGNWLRDVLDPHNKGL